MQKRSFIPFPSLTTEHYLLRQLQQHDDEAIYILRTDENVNRYLDRQKATSIEDARAFINKINDAVVKGSSILWAICTKNNPALMGTICLWGIDETQSTAEIGYELLPAFQGKGILQEVMPVVIRYGFETMGLQLMEASLTADNERSLKLLQKNRFVPAVKAKSNTPAEDNMVTYILGTNT